MKTTFEAMYQAQYEKLYTLAFRMTGNKEDAEDVLQTAFLNAYKAFNRFRHDSAVSTWLYRIVMNVAKKYAKESRKLPVEEYAEEHQISQADVYNYINRFGQDARSMSANVYELHAIKVSCRLYASHHT
jgi:RNA polymerase sigma-70 factor (ECF subfamily)